MKRIRVTIKKMDDGKEVIHIDQPGTFMGIVADRFVIDDQRPRFADAARVAGKPVSAMAAANGPKRRFKPRGEPR